MPAVPTRLGVWSMALIVILGAAALLGPAAYDQTGRQRPAEPVLQAVTDDAGDRRATTTHDGPMLRRRTAIAIHPTKGADRAQIRRQLRAAADSERLGPLTDVTFAVFSEALLTYLVPQVAVVLPEGATLHDAEVLMRDHDHPTVAFHLVESVLVHDLTFAVIPRGVDAAEARNRIDREGVLADSLGQHKITTQRSGLTVTYFGAVVSDGQVVAVQESMARAAGVTPGQVFVAASSPGAGVDLADEPAPQAHPEHGD